MDRIFSAWCRINFLSQIIVRSHVKESKVIWISWFIKYMENLSKVLAPLWISLDRYGKSRLQDRSGSPSCYRKRCPHKDVVEEKIISWVYYQYPIWKKYWPLQSIIWTSDATITFCSLQNIRSEIKHLKNEEKRAKNHLF